MAPRLFRDRRDAGRQLAVRLESYRDKAPLVLGLARGGVSVAFEVAKALEGQLDVWMVRKIHARTRPELHLGSVCEGGDVFLDLQAAALLESRVELNETIALSAAEVEERGRCLRRGRVAPDVARRTVVVVDDGVVTGATAGAALRSLRRREPAYLVLAVPIAPCWALEALERRADHVVCLAEAPGLFALGPVYDEYPPISDEEAAELLERARAAWVEPRVRQTASGQT